MLVRLSIAKKGDRTWWIKDQHGFTKHILLGFTRTTHEDGTAVIYSIIAGPFALRFGFPKSNPTLHPPGCSAAEPR